VRVCLHDRDPDPLPKKVVTVVTAETTPPMAEVLQRRCATPSGNDRWCDELGA
jgi:hypothetical protein